MVPRLTVLVELKALETQKMSELIEETSRSREELSTAKGDTDRLEAENKVVLAVGMDISELNKSIGFLVGSINEKKAGAVDSQKNL